MVERVLQLGELVVVELYGEVLLNGRVVAFARGAQCRQAVWRDEYQDGAPVVFGTFSADKTRFVHVVDDAGEAALAREDAASEVVHAEAFGCVLEVDERVVPPQ